MVVKYSCFSSKCHFSWCIGVLTWWHHHNISSRTWTVMSVLIHHNVLIAWSRGRQGRTPPQGSNSFISCSFRQKNCKIIALWELAPSSQGKSWIRHWVLRDDGFQTKRPLIWSGLDNSIASYLFSCLQKPSTGQLWYSEHKNQHSSQKSHPRRINATLLVSPQTKLQQQLASLLVSPHFAKTESTGAENVFHS